ncbi:hypothetical protein TRFO_28888 [Tritrichomonas foetus]|uniref:TPR Domain containing protein n=1 Tax=Tritrichomonas foetus TaxID=1144522 RepID=A0A1J4K1L3_9EUKA|nr:hypothetical protein TRFO_28888 [Tritrichomonas foetus]|eukprot:OHT03638.1 hypothetical protein TRFO_28888 [Tritrichomonas foetus]
MERLISIKFLSDDLLSFDQICERITDEGTAEQLCNYIKSQNEASLNFFDTDYLATVLLHCGYEELFVSALEERYNLQKKSNNKKSSIWTTHLGLFYLQKAAQKIDVASNLEKAKGHIDDAISVDPKSPFALIAQCFYLIIKSEPGSYHRALETTNRIKIDKERKEYIVDLEPLRILCFALAHYHNEKYDEALKYFIDFLGSYAKACPLVRLGIGQALMASNKPDKAEYAFKRVLSLEPENVDSLTGLGILKFNENTAQGLTESQTILRKILTLNPEYSPSLILQAHILFNSSYIDRTIKVAKKANTYATTNKMRADAYFISGQWQHHYKKLDKAKECYERVVKYNPGHVKANFYLGLFESKENPKKAIEYISGVHQSLYDVFEANAAIGLSYARLYQSDPETNKDMLKQAVKYLKAASNQNATKDTEKIKVLSTLGWLRIKSLKFGKAETAYSEAVKIYPKSENDNEEEAETNNNDQPQNGEIISLEQLLTFLGIAQFQNGKYEDALATFTKSEEEFHKTNPDEKAPPLLRYNMALCKEELNKFNQAKSDYKSLHEDYPTFPEPLLRIAALAVRDTRPNFINTEAKEALETVVTEIDKNHVKAWLELANVNARTRQLQEAKKIMQKTQEQAGEGDGFIYSTISMGNYFLESAQNKDNPKERTDRLKHAQIYYLKALRHNHYCVAAANGLAICWLLNGHADHANPVLQQVRENRPDQSSSWENLGLACMKNNQYQQANTLFEGANKKFFDKTDINLLLQSYYASKGDKKWDNCLQVAETLCQLRPENDTHWYLLASSLHKVVISQSSPRALQGRNLRVVTVERWIAQLKRCISLYDTFMNTTIGKQNESSIQQKIEAVNEKLERLAALREKAKEKEQKKRERNEQLAREYAKDTDE